MSEKDNLQKIISDRADAWINESEDDKDTLRAEIERLESCFLEFETITDKGLYARVSDIVKVLDNVRTENERLREALEVYADKKNWKNDDWGILSVFSRDDGGVGYGNPTAIAREALEVKEQK